MIHGFFVVGGQGPTNSHYYRVIAGVLLEFEAFLCVTGIYGCRLFLAKHVTYLVVVESGIKYWGGRLKKADRRRRIPNA